MKGRLALGAMLAGSLAFLVSLYLPWAGETALPSRGAGSGISSLLNLVDAGGFSGWYSTFGDAAGLIAAGLLAAAAMQLARRPVLERVPLATGSLALLFFTVMDAAFVWNYAQTDAAHNQMTAHIAYGAYVGFASAAVVVLSALGLPWRELERISLPGIAGAGLALGLLAAILVPQLTFTVPALPKGGDIPFGYELAFTSAVPEIVVCGLALFGLPLLLRGAPARVVRAGAGAIAVLTAAYLVPFRSDYAQWPWWLWLWLACAIALVVLTLGTGGRLRFTHPSTDNAAIVAGGTLLLVSLFLPWLTQANCSERCFLGSEGWTQGGGLAGILAVLLLAGVLAYGRVLGEFAIGTALYVLSAGLTTNEYAKYGARFAYGAPIGFAGATLLLLFAVRRLRPIPRARYLMRIVPLCACLGFLSFAVVPLTESDTAFAFQSPWQQRVFLLTAAAIVLTLRLVLRWSERPRDSDEVVLLPLGLLTLTVIDLVVIRSEGISWEGWAAVFLCLLLAACGWVERYGGGLDRFQIPEAIWRIDRLPPVED